MLNDPILNDPILNKLHHFREALKSYFKERENIIEALFIGLLSRHHLLMVGPPGSGKSYLIEIFTGHLENNKFFSWQVTKSTYPEELFGPYSVTKLTEDELIRKTEGKLPEADYAYIDEVFNASSAILNTLNSIMNERTFQGVKVPLKQMYGATNTIPEEPLLLAFFDRFLFRFIVEYIHEEEAWISMLLSDEFKQQNYRIDENEIETLRSRIKDVDVSAVILKLVRIRGELNQESIEPSDRRFKWLLEAMRARAVLYGRSKCTDDDLQIAKYILWTEANEIKTVHTIVLKAIDPAFLDLADLANIVRDLNTQLRNLHEDDADVHIILREIKAKLKGTAEEIASIQKRPELIDSCNSEAQRIIGALQQTSQLYNRVYKRAEKAGEMDIVEIPL